MKVFFFACFTAITLGACNSSDEKPDVVTVNTKDLLPSPVVHDSLTTEQLEKVKHIQKTFAEVFPASLEETVTNFKRDQNPDKEIAVWLNMAAVYENFLSKHAVSEAAKKEEVFKLILLQSMMPDEEAVKEAGIKTLTQKEVDELLASYDANAAPLTIQNRQ